MNYFNPLITKKNQKQFTGRYDYNNFWTSYYSPKRSDNKKKYDKDEESSSYTESSRSPSRKLSPHPKYKSTASDSRSSSLSQSRKSRSKEKSSKRSKSRSNSSSYEEGLCNDDKGYSIEEGENIIESNNNKTANNTKNEEEKKKNSNQSIYYDEDLPVYDTDDSDDAIYNEVMSRKSKIKENHNVSNNKSTMNDLMDIEKNRCSREVVSESKCTLCRLGFKYIK